MLEKEGLIKGYNKKKLKLMEWVYDRISRRLG